MSTEQAETAFKSRGWDYSLDFNGGVIIIDQTPEFRASYWPRTDRFTVVFKGERLRGKRLGTLLSLVNKRKAISR